MGKSSFINSVLGEARADTHDFEPCTPKPASFEAAVSSGKIRLIDTPGLGVDENQDKGYLETLGSIDLTEIHGILYVSRLDETRFRPEEKKVLDALVRLTGYSSWLNARLVLTFAAKCPLDELWQRVDQRQQQIEGYMRRRLSHRRFRFLDVYPIDNLEEDWHPDARCIGEVLGDAVQVDWQSPSAS